MSFSSLKGSRTGKKSFVASSQELSGHSGAADKVSNLATPSNPVLPPPSDPLRQCIPDGTEVKETQDEGRGMFATVPFSPGRPSIESFLELSLKRQWLQGSIIATVRPHMFTVSTACLSAYCSNCCASPPTTGLKRCPRCRTIWYCNTVRASRTSDHPDIAIIVYFILLPKTCQNGDWALHKHECKALQSWKQSAPSLDVSIPSDAVRCLGRVAWRMQKEGRDSDWVGSTSLDIKVSECSDIDWI